MWRCTPLGKHINHLVVEYAPAIFLENLVSLIDKKVFNRNILHQNQQVEQAFWGHGKDIDKLIDIQLTDEFLISKLNILISYLAFYIVNFFAFLSVFVVIKLSTLSISV